MTRQQVMPAIVFAMLALSASAFVVKSPIAAHSAAFGAQTTSKPLLTRSNMAVDTELEEKTDNPTLGIVTFNKTTAVQVVEDDCEVPEEQSETQKLMSKVKEAGTAGIISYALWELGFWFLSVPVCVVGYQQVTGHWPDLSNSDDQAKLGAEAFAFVNFARFAVPLRIGLALSTTPWIQENVVDLFMKKDETPECDPLMNDSSSEQ